MDPTMNPTATSILDQAAQSYLDASYEAWKIDQQPLSRKISQIQRLPKSQQDAAIMEVVQEIGSTGDMKTLIYLALDGMKAAEQRNQAQSTYCQARAMAEQLGLKEAQNA